VAIVAPLAAVRAQTTPADVEVVLRAASAQKNAEMLEKPAAALEASKNYEAAQKLRELAVSIREEVSGKQSVEYGVGLMKIADLEKKRNHPKEAAAFYTKALMVLGDRAEAAPALLYLGMREKNLEYLKRAQLLDPALAGQAMMWMALIREREPNPVEAEALYKAALAAENPNSVEAENTMELYARFLKNQGREDEGQAMLDEVAIARKGRLVQGTSTALRVGGGISAPSVLYKVEPAYTEEARAAKYSGTVVVTVEIQPDGTAQNIRIVKGLGLGLDEKAVEAISQWRFKPGMKGDVPVTVAANIEVNFRLM
jgi:TonB family protein